MPSAKNFGKARVTKNNSIYVSWTVIYLSESTFCQENFEFWAVFWAFWKITSHRSSICKYYASI